MTMASKIGIAMVITLIIALFIEGSKIVRKVMRRSKLEKERMVHKVMLMEYLVDRFESNHNKLVISHKFADLMVTSYLVYISNMAESIVNPEGAYELDEDDNNIYFIEGTTSDKNRKLIRKLIHEEVKNVLYTNTNYVRMLRISTEDLKLYTDYTIDYIENSIDFQMVCSNTVLDVLGM